MGAPVPLGSSQENRRVAARSSPLSDGIEGETLARWFASHCIGTGPPYHPCFRRGPRRGFAGTKVLAEWGSPFLLPGRRPKWERCYQAVWVGVGSLPAASSEAGGGRRSDR